MDIKTQLINDLDESRAAMHDAIKDFDPTRTIYPGWTLKHMLGHIAGWDEATIVILKAFEKDDEPDIVIRSIDEYNQYSIDTRVELDLDRIQREWELVRQNLKAIIQKIPLEKFPGNLPFPYPWGGRGSVADLVGIMVHHEKEHAKEIAEMKHTTD